MKKKTWTEREFFKTFDIKSMFSNTFLAGKINCHSKEIKIRFDSTGINENNKIFFKNKFIT